jgi:hypothetical protein
MSYSFTTLAAHIHRDGEISLTLLIERDGLNYRLRQEGSDEIIVELSSPYDVQRAADMYMAGFIAGYDEGFEKGFDDGNTESENRSPKLSAHATLRQLGRGSAFESVGRDREDDEGTGESVSQD